MKEGTTIYFVRHGQTYLNKYNSMQGWANAPLTPEGIGAIETTGKHLANIQFDAVYTSDLPRAQETARIIMRENLATAPEIPIIPKPEFREVFFGSFEGRDAVWTYDHVAKLSGFESEQDMRAHVSHAQIMNAFHRIDPTHDAENFSMFWRRVEHGLIQLIQHHRKTEDTILVVGHGACIHYMIENIVPNPENMFALPNASVSRVRYHNGQFHLDYYGRTEHLLLEDGE